MTTSTSVTSNITWKEDGAAFYSAQLDSIVYILIFPRFIVHAKNTYGEQVSIFPIHNMVAVCFGLAVTVPCRRKGKRKAKKGQLSSSARRTKLT